MTDAKTAVPISHDASPTSPTNITDQSQGVTMEAIPLWKRVWRHSLTQMMLLSVQAFCGPAMSDAITGLGGGGLATPQVSNISTAIRYATLAVVNKIGVKWALVIGSMSFPIQGSAYYCNSKFGNQWYLILSGAIGGIGTACWYVAEAGAIMTLAPSGARGKYLALWIVSRNLGQLVGGAINLPFALLITPFERVIRSDGTQIVTAETLSTKQELKRIVKTITSRLIVLSSLWALWSFFYTIGCFGLGYILDMKGLSQRRRAQIGLYTVVVLNVGVYIWSIIMQTKFNRHDPGHIDWDDGLCVTFALLGASLLPMIMLVNTTPDRIPADVIAEQQDVAREKLESA
ncbi:hypothetical protein APSETT444_003205 [Aspergillus pseudonomiae]